MIEAQPFIELEKLEVYFQARKVNIRVPQVENVRRQAQIIKKNDSGIALLCGYDIGPDLLPELMCKRLLSVKYQLIAFGVRPSKVKLLFMKEVIDSVPFYNGKVVTRIFD